jgi:hypothetical protein
LELGRASGGQLQPKGKKAAEDICVKFEGNNVFSSSLLNCIFIF